MKDIKWCYIHYSFMFLHYHITCFPAHFEDMVKKLDGANDDEEPEVFGRLVELIYPSGSIHTVTYHFAACCAPGSALWLVSITRGRQSNVTVSSKIISPALLC